jgi:hypothetical protein
MEQGRMRHMTALFSPDGKLAAVLPYGDRLVIWDVATGKEAYNWPMPTSMADPHQQSQNRFLNRQVASLPIASIWPSRMRMAPSTS